MLEVFKKTIILFNIAINQKNKTRVWKIIFGFFVVTFFDLASVWLLIHSIFLLESPEKASKSQIVQLFSQFLDKEQTNIIYVLFIFLFLVYLVKNLLSQFVVHYQNNVLADIGSDILKIQIQKYFTKGDFFKPDIHSSQIKHGLTYIPEFFIYQVLNPFFLMLSEVLVIVCLTFAILYLNASVAIILVMVMLPLSVLTYRSLKNAMMNAQSESNEIRVRNNQYADEMIFGYVDITLNSKENIYLDRFLNNQSSNFKNQSKYFTLDASQSKIIELIAILSIVVIFTVAILLKLNYTQIAFLITAFAGSAFRLLPSINKILNSFLRLNSFCHIVFEELSGITKKDFEALNHKNSAELFLHKKISLNNIDFYYPETEKRILKNLNLEINKSEIVGLIGPSGAGKSTLVKILLGFLKPVSGEVLCDEVLVDEKTMDSWRKITNYVRQDFYLVHGSIAQNISLEIDESLIDNQWLMSCIEKAQLSTFVNELPEKEKTMIGEMGSAISGGQKQRIAIARALYSKCEFLVLDEATSALDQETENGILETIKNLNQEGLTVLIIAHKNSTLRICDRVFTLNNGEIALFQQEI